MDEKHTREVIILVCELRLCGGGGWCLVECRCMVYDEVEVGYKGLLGNETSRGLLVGLQGMGGGE